MLGGHTQEEWRGLHSCWTEAMEWYQESLKLNKALNDILIEMKAEISKK